MKHEEILDRLTWACEGAYVYTRLNESMLRDYVSMAMAWGVGREEIIKNLYDHSTMSLVRCKKIVDDYDKWCMNASGSTGVCVRIDGVTYPSKSMAGQALGKDLRAINKMIHDGEATVITGRIDYE